jgi:hypothetical protein
MNKTTPNLISMLFLFLLLGFGTSGGVSTPALEMLEFYLNPKVKFCFSKPKKKKSKK